jgi:6-phosphogluconolactonase (cycloisomerase 2 family)
MGGSKIMVVNNKTWKIETYLNVPPNPRHVILDALGHLFVSFNSSSQIANIDTRTGKILFKAQTHAQPRTIALSKNQKFLFVTCYAGNTVDVFKINKQSFDRIYSIKCSGKPVGIDLYEDEAKLEAWVCNYIAGNISVYTFKKVAYTDI